MDVDDRPGYLFDHVTAWASIHNVKTPEDLHKSNIDLQDFVDTLLSIAGVFPEEDYEL